MIHNSIQFTEELGMSEKLIFTGFLVIGIDSTIRQTRICRRDEAWLKHGIDKFADNTHNSLSVLSAGESGAYDA